jgi:hypothetical protein
MTLASRPLGSPSVADQQRTLTAKHIPPPKRQAIAVADEQSAPAPDPR